MGTQLLTGSDWFVVLFGWCPHSWQFLTLEVCLWCKKASKIRRRETNVGTVVAFLKAGFHLVSKGPLSLLRVLHMAASPISLTGLSLSLWGLQKRRFPSHYSCSLSVETASPQCILCTAPSATGGYYLLELPIVLRARVLGWTACCCDVEAPHFL